MTQTIRNELFMKNKVMNNRIIICALVLFWLSTITTTGTCLAAEKGHAEKNAALGTDTLDALRYIREELRLARDLYGALSDIWGLEVFENTAKSKQSLMNAVSYVLKPDGFDGPTEDAGKFVDSDLQELYSYLIDQGKGSRNNAIDVSILIEQTVIADINDVFLQTNAKDVHKVLILIMEGSENHLHELSRYLVMY
jgi:hypothetical protein